MLLREKSEAECLLLNDTLRSNRSIIGFSTSRATLRVPEDFDDTVAE
jgi:hypothetical protein